MQSRCSGDQRIKTHEAERSSALDYLKIAVLECLKVAASLAVSGSFGNFRKPI